MNALTALTLARQHGVSPAMLHVMLVAVSDSPAMPTRIAEATGLTPAAITGTCDRLERDGWITRLGSALDRRSVLIFPTELAFELFTPML